LRELFAADRMALGLPNLEHWLRGALAGDGRPVR
jgi:hypothetical protein